MAEGRSAKRTTRERNALADRLLAAPARLRVPLLREAAASAGIVQELASRAALKTASDPRAALQAARLAGAVAELSGSPVDRAVAAHARARVLHRTGHFVAAEAGYRAAREGYRRHGLRSEVADVETARIDALLHAGRPCAAERVARAALAGLRGDAYRAARVLMNLANVRHAQDRLAEAVRLLERARPAFAAAADRMRLASVDANLALVYSDMARFELSEPLAREARRAYAELGETMLVAQVEYHLAFDLYLQGRLHEARQLLRQVRGAFRSAGARHGLALASLDEAEMDLAFGDPERAYESALEARQAFLAAGVPLEAGRAALVEAEAARARGDEALATERLGDARRTFARLRSRGGLGSADLGLAASDRLPLEARERHARRAARAFLSAGLAAKEGTALVVAGSLAVARGRRTAGRRALGRARSIARRRGLPELELRAEHALARADGAAGEPMRALRGYRRAAGAYERLRAGMRSEHDRLAFASDRTAIFREGVQTALDLGRVEEAFAFVERARARALVDLLATDARFESAALRSGGVLARRLAALKRELDRLEPRDGPALRRTASVSPELGVRLARLVAERDEALAALALRHPEATYAVSGWPIAPLDELRRTLGEDRALVAYFDEGESLGAILVSAGGLQAYRGLVDRKTLDRMIAALHFALNAPRIEGARGARSDALRGAAESVLDELRRVLLGPLEAALGDRGLVVVPTAALHVVPFHALSRRGRPLIAEREVTIAPSATVLVRAQARVPRTRGALVVSAPDALAPLIASEARSVAASLGARILEGPEATAASLRREGPRARLLHIAAHGVYEPGEPLWSGLELADGRLTLPEVAALGLDAALVVLSACESGLGRPRGDEVLGLVRSFLQAGTRSLLASLWSVNDTSTAALMDAFYQGIGRGEGTAAALRGACLASREERPHPYDWAPFVLVGGWGPVLPPGGSFR